MINLAGVLWAKHRPAMLSRWRIRDVRHIAIWWVTPVDIETHRVTKHHESEMFVAKEIIHVPAFGTNVFSSTIWATKKTQHTNIGHYMCGKPPPMSRSKWPNKPLEISSRILSQPGREVDVVMFHLQKRQHVWRQGPKLRRTSHFYTTDVVCIPIFGVSCLLLSIKGLTASLHHTEKKVRTLKSTYHMSMLPAIPYHQEQCPGR